MVIITAKRKGELMRKTSEKILRALLAVSVLATAVLSSGCLDDEEEISDSTASDNRQTSDGGTAESSEGSEGSDNKYDGKCYWQSCVKADVQRLGRDKHCKKTA